MKKKYDVLRNQLESELNEVFRLVRLNNISEAISQFNSLSEKVLKVPNSRKLSPYLVNAKYIFEYVSTFGVNKSFLREMALMRMYGMSNENLLGNYSKPVYFPVYHLVGLLSHSKKTDLEGFNINPIYYKSPDVAILFYTLYYYANHDVNDEQTAWDVLRILIGLHKRVVANVDELDLFAYRKMVFYYLENESIYPIEFLPARLGNTLLNLNLAIQRSVFYIINGDEVQKGSYPKAYAAFVYPLPKGGLKMFHTITLRWLRKLGKDRNAFWIESYRGEELEAESLEERVAIREGFIVINGIERTLNDMQSKKYSFLTINKKFSEINM